MRSSFIAFGAIVLLVPGTALAVTRDIAELQTAPLTLRESVISQLSAGVLKDPYDEFLDRPYNLDFANIERYANLSPWPGQQGEQSRYVDVLIGNNGNSNVRNGADTLQGTYIGQSMAKMTWGVSAAYLSDVASNADAIPTASFSDGETLDGVDARFAVGYRLSDRIMLGGGLGLFQREDQVEDGSFSSGTGGFYSLQEVQQKGVEADFGLRLFRGERSSWDAKLLVGLGNSDVNDYSEDLDAAGAVISRFVVTDYAISDSAIEVSGGYNRRHVNAGGEWQVRAGYRLTSHELDNNDLAYTDDAGTVTPSLTLLGQDPVTTNELFVSADTLFLRGWTQIFGAARLSLAKVDGSTQVDSLGNIVDESIDDSESAVGVVMGLRQPLWNEKFRLVARARADWTDRSQETSFSANSTSTDSTQTTTAFAVGIETVLNNMVFDLAWLFGGEPGPGSANEASRQTIDLNRLVVSATFGW